VTDTVVIILIVRDNVTEIGVVPRSVFVFCVDLRTNSDNFPIQH